MNSLPVLTVAAGVSEAVSIVAVGWLAMGAVGIPQFQTPFLPTLYFAGASLIAASALHALWVKARKRAGL